MQDHLEIAGVTVPRIGIGTWEVTGDDCYRAVRHALDVGYRHIDTAQLYGNEEQVGRAIADSDVPRDELFVTTKVWRDEAAPEDVRTSTQASLRRLGLDHVDLLLIHWPADDIAPMSETLGAMAGLRESGDTRLIGVSNFTSEQANEAARLADIATDQVEYHPFLDQEPVLQAVRKHGLFLTAYSPLAHGDAIGDEVLTEIGQAHDASAAQVALAWLLAQDDVVVLPRSQDEQHLEDNLAARELELSEDELQRIDALPKDRRLISPPFAPDWD